VTAAAKTPKGAVAAPAPGKGGKGGKGKAAPPPPPSSSSEDDYDDEDDDDDDDYTGKAKAGRGKAALLSDEDEDDDDEPVFKAKSKPFSDDNQQWLKLAEDNSMDEDNYSDEDDSDDFDDDEGESEEESEDDVDLTKFEREAKALGKRQKEDAALADAEMQLNIENTEKFALPSGEEIEKIQPGSEDLAVVQMRIRENLGTLANFKVGVACLLCLFACFALLALLCLCWFGDDIFAHRMPQVLCTVQDSN
jgi:ribosomal RNA methyltransferase Nop2